MPNLKRKFKRAKLRKKGLLHEKKPQYTKLDISGTLSSVASEMSNLFSTTANVLRQIPSGIYQIGEAVREDPGVVISHTLIGSIGGLVLGPMELVLGETEQNKIYGQKLDELAKGNADCEYVQTQLKETIRHEIFCPGNNTLQNELSSSARIVSRQTVPLLPYALEGVKYGLTLGGVGGFVHGAYQALIDKHKRQFNPTYPKHGITVLINAFKTDYETTVHEISQGINRHFFYYPFLAGAFGLLYGNIMNPKFGLFTAGFTLCAGMGAGVLDGSFQVVKKKRSLEPKYIRSGNEKFHLLDIDSMIHAQIQREKKLSDANNVMRLRDKNLFDANSPTLFSKIGSRALLDGQVPDFLQVGALTAGSFLLLDSLNVQWSFIAKAYASSIGTILNMLKFCGALSTLDATRDITSVIFILGIFGMQGAMKLSDLHPVTKIGLSLFSLTFGMLSILSDFYKLHTSYFRKIELTEKKDEMPSIEINSDNGERNVERNTFLKF